MKKTSIYTAGMVLVAGLAAGCSGGSPKPTGGTTNGVPTIIIYNGIRGYYLNNQFCYYGNNYCGTGKDYGILVPTIVIVNNYYGYYTGSDFCDWSNDYCGTGLSYGIGTGYCTYNYCGIDYGPPGGYSSGSSGSAGSSGSSGGYYGGSSGSSGSSGSVGSSGSSGSTGGYYGSSGSSGSTGSSGSGGYYGSSGSSGSTGSSGSGGYYGSSGSSGSTGSSGSGGYYGSSGSSGSTGSSGSSGSSGSYYGSSGSSGSSGSYYGSSGSSGSSGSGGYSLAGGTKDVDLQRAVMQHQQIENRAQTLASRFSMSLEVARQLTQISDQMAAFQSKAGGMTPEETISLENASLGVLHISRDEVTAATAAYLKGDKSAMNNLLVKGALAAGMPAGTGAATIRDQILPSIGVSLGASQAQQ